MERKNFDWSTLLFFMHCALCRGLCSCLYRRKPISYGLYVLTVNFTRIVQRRIGYSIRQRVMFPLHSERRVIREGGWGGEFRSRKIGVIPCYTKTSSGFAGRKTQNQQIQRDQITSHGIAAVLPSTSSVESRGEVRPIVSPPSYWYHLAKSVSFGKRL